MNEQVLRSVEEAAKKVFNKHILRFENLSISGIIIDILYAYGRYGTFVLLALGIKDGLTIGV